MLSRLEIKCFLESTIYLILIKIFIIKIESSPIKVLDTGILPLHQNSVGIQFYLDFENTDKMNPCKIYTRPSNCCLYINKDKKDCGSMKIYGETIDKLKPNGRKTYLYVYPTLAQLNQQGYCLFTLQYRCGRRTQRLMSGIKIPFDTQYKKRSSNRYLLKNFRGTRLSHCKNLDEDPLNNCKPVNCDKKYSGEKPFYDRNLSLCVPVPECVSSTDKTLPDKAYEPRSNTCKDLDRSLSVTDIYLLASGLGVYNTPLYDDELKVPYKINCSTVSQNVCFLRDMLLGKLHSFNHFKIDYTESCNNAIMSILTCVITVSTGLIFFICLVTIIIWAYEQWKIGGFKGKVSDLRSRIVSAECGSPVTTNKGIRNKLLRDVIVSDLPVELQDSSMEAMIGKDVRWKRRYRTMDMGSRVDLRYSIDSDTDTTSDLDVGEKEKLLKR